MSKDKYPSIFSRQMEAIVFIIMILQIVFATRAVLKIGEYSRIFPSFSRGIAHFADTAAILNSIVSNLYYGMVWKIAPRPSHNRYLKQ